MKSGGVITGRLSLDCRIVIGGPVELLLVRRSPGPLQDWNPRILMWAPLEIPGFPETPDVENDLTGYKTWYIDVTDDMS